MTEEYKRINELVDMIQSEVDSMQVANDIGGFPLCWERCNGAGTAIWASEIEEFPIAVTKKHFAEEKQK